MQSTKLAAIFYLRTSPKCGEHPLCKKHHVGRLWEGHQNGSAIKDMYSYDARGKEVKSTFSEIVSSDGILKEEWVFLTVG